MIPVTVYWGDLEAAENRVLDETIEDVYFGDDADWAEDDGDGGEAICFWEKELDMNNLGRYLDGSWTHVYILSSNHPSEWPDYSSVSRLLTCVCNV